MPRRGIVTRKETLPDPVYGSKLVSQIINKVLLDGKRSTAETIVYGGLETVRAKSGRDPVEVLQESIQTLTPHLEVRSRRVGGATYQVPVEVPGRRARTLAIRWLVSFSRERREKIMSERLAAEILDSLAGQGGAFKKKDDIFRMAQANRAFAHYRW
jgi:small subunit ribosomal protein S7